MNSKLFLQCVAAFGVLVTVKSAAQDDISRPDDHAPIGVMGDHFHEAGEFMFSYRFMTMDMHMFGLMYAPTDRVDG